ncbi:hypothetical protein SAMN05216241_11039 [Limimonas halophila]|uniref:Uncharacterized protein n=1 Tax=Limimonas halophila TaxID=1082479 RepID=A0A1G7TRT6_9PROT|nr:hypothetical protein SAMN05216241_11039 [Limimonas halophila]
MPADGAAALQGAAKVGVWAMTNGTAGPHVAARDRLPAKLSLEPGRYRLLVRYQGARRVIDRTLEAGDGPATWRIDLRAGHVRLELRPQPGQPPIAGELGWKVRTYARGKAAGKQVAEAAAARPRLLLDAGWYEVAVTNGGRTHEHVVQVRPGEDVVYSVIARDGGS